MKEEEREEKAGYTYAGGRGRGGKYAEVRGEREVM